MINDNELSHARSVIDRHNHENARVYICIRHEFAGCGCVNSNGFEPHYKSYPIDTDPYKMY